jgi:hypothetical protein
MILIRRKIYVNSKCYIYPELQWKLKIVQHSLFRENWKLCNILCLRKSVEIIFSQEKYWKISSGTRNYSQIYSLVKEKDFIAWWILSQRNYTVPMSEWTTWLMKSCSKVSEMHFHAYLCCSLMYSRSSTSHHSLTRGLWEYVIVLLIAMCRWGI